MTEKMNYGTYGRSRHRSTRRVANNRKPQVQKPTSSQLRESSKPESRDKQMKRRSDPDGAYCLSSEEHSNKVKDRTDKTRNDSRGKQRGSDDAQEKLQSTSSNQPESSSASTTRRKSSSNATLTRQPRSVERSTSPRPSRGKTVASKPRSASSRPSRPRSSESFNEKRQRSNSLKSCRSTKSSKSIKSEAPTLTSELSGFDLKQSCTENHKSGTKNFFMKKIAGFSILGGCSKKPQSRPHRRPPNTRTRSRTSVTSTAASTATPRTRLYQLEDGSSTCLSEGDRSSSYSCSSDSEFNSSYESFSVSDSSSDEECFTSMRESEDTEIFEVMHKSVSSFVEDEFDTDAEDEISGADDFVDGTDSKSPSISSKSRALIHALEAENEALRANVVALRTDWETIVIRMTRIQDGGDDSQPSNKSPNLEAVIALRDHAMQVMKQKQDQDLILRNKREADLKSCIECVEELLCENERLYDHILKLSQEREDILQEMTALRNQAVTSLEESHHSLLANEQFAKSHGECIENIASSLTTVKNEVDEGKEGLDNQIMLLVTKIKSHGVDIRSSFTSKINRGEQESNDDERPSAEDSALVVARNPTSSSGGSSRRTLKESILPTKRSTSTSDRSSRSRTSAALNDSNETPVLRRATSSSREIIDVDETPVRRNSACDDLVRLSSMFSDDSSYAGSDRGDDEYSSDESDNSFFEAEPDDLDIIYESDDDDDSFTVSECSSVYDDNLSPLPMCPKRKSWYNAVRSLLPPAKPWKKGRRPQTKSYYVDDNEDTRSKRSEDTFLSDIENTHYPADVISRSSPSTSSSSRSANRSRIATLRDSSICSPVPELEKYCSTDYGASEQQEDEYNESKLSATAPLPCNDDLQTSYMTRSPSNAPNDFIVKPLRSASTTCASVSHGDNSFFDDYNASYATSGSESTKERKGITITVVSRSSRFLNLPSSRSHTYMTIFTASLLKNQIDEVLCEQYHESMKEIVESTSKKKDSKKYRGDINEDGERHGYGIYKSKNGNEYRGEWLNNKREGLGVVKIGNGDVFEGQFQHNMKNGAGVYHYIDGECDLSSYKDDIRVGKSLRYTKDRRRAYILTGNMDSKEISLREAAIEARRMGVVIQL